MATSPRPTGYSSGKKVMTDSATEIKAGPAAEAFATRVRAQMRDAPGAACAWFARTRASFDVMGGITEYTGGMTLSVSSKDTVLAAARPRDDQRIHVALVGDCGDGVPDGTAWPLSAFYDATGALVSPDAIHRMACEVKCRAARAVLPAVFALLESGRVPHLGGGFSVVIQTSLPISIESGLAGAVQGAALSTITPVLGATIEPLETAALCRRAQLAVDGHPCGLASQAGPLVGEPGTLLQACNDPFELSGCLALPDGVTILAIDSGAKPRAAAQKHLQARVAAEMGCQIIRRVLKARRQDHRWDGYLARLVIADYIDLFRDRLPTKLRGGVFVDRFGELDGQCVSIDRDAVYKVRSRTEHHIYENDRARQFAERIARAGRAGREPTLNNGPAAAGSAGEKGQSLPRRQGQPALPEAGELMYGSHWSYGQRCGLGSIETDLLVNLLRAQGPHDGIFGARISGPGAGGLVVVLMRDSDESHAAVDRVVRSYQDRTSLTARLLPIAATGDDGFAVERLS